MEKEIVTLKKTLTSLSKDQQIHTNLKENPFLGDGEGMPIVNPGDLRCCVLCGRTGDDLPIHSGRLLPMALNQWIHLNCAKVKIKLICFFINYMD